MSTLFVAAITCRGTPPNQSLVIRPTPSERGSLSYRDKANQCMQCTRAYTCSQMHVHVLLKGRGTHDTEMEGGLDRRYWAHLDVTLGAESVQLIEQLQHGPLDLPVPLLLTGKPLQEQKQPQIHSLEPRPSHRKYCCE